MLRIMGILAGAALAIGALIIALGVPKLAPPDDDAELAIEAAPVTEPAATTEITPAAEPEPEPAPELASAPVETAVAEAPDAEPPPRLEAMPEPAAAPVAVVAENWYAFWSPFRSEIAAQGFVARLQETTGIDYRVVKVKTGVYEVTFAYVDAADIEDKLARISDATGLDMSGG